MSNEELTMLDEERRWQVMSGRLDAAVEKIGNIQDTLGPDQQLAFLWELGRLVDTRRATLRRRMERKSDSFSRTAGNGWGNEVTNQGHVPESPDIAPGNPITYAGSLFEIGIRLSPGTEVAPLGAQEWNVLRQIADGEYGRDQSEGQEPDLDLHKLVDGLNDLTVDVHEELDARWVDRGLALLERADDNLAGTNKTILAVKLADKVLNHL